MAKKTPKDESEKVLVDTQLQVAKAFGVSERTVRNWVADDMPVRGDGRYDLKAIQGWKFVQAEKHPGGRKKKSADESGQNWEEEYRKWKAMAEELRYKKMTGDLIDRADVEKGLIHISTVVKRAFLALPKSISPQLAGLEPREILRILTGKIRHIIGQFATNKIFEEIELQMSFDDLEDDKDPADSNDSDDVPAPAAPEPPPQRVDRKTRIKTKAKRRPVAKRKNSARPR